MQIHVLDWPIGLNTSAVEVRNALIRSKGGGSRAVHSEECIACSVTPTPRRARHSGSLKGTWAMSWCASALTPPCWSSGPMNRSAACAYLAGSIGHFCISHASCPVVTVPEQVPDSNGLPDHDTGHHASRVAAASGPPQPVTRRICRQARPNPSFGWTENMSTLNDCDRDPLNDLEHQLNARSPTRRTFGTSEASTRPRADQLRTTKKDGI